MVLGITGGYCAGKSAYAKMLTERGFIEIDVDVVGHTALQVHQDTIIAIFGDTITTESGTINRKALGKIVFHDKKKLRILESIVHPWMIQNISRTIAQHSTKHWIINAALLYHLQLDMMCDKVVVIKTVCITRFIRALRRDQLGIWNTLLRFTKQYPTPSKKKLLKLRTKYVEQVVVGTSRIIQWEKIVPME